MHFLQPSEHFALLFCFLLFSNVLLKNWKPDCMHYPVDGIVEAKHESKINIFLFLCLYID